MGSQGQIIPNDSIAAIKVSQLRFQSPYLLDIPNSLLCEALAIPYLKYLSH